MDDAGDAGVAPVVGSVPVGRKPSFFERINWSIFFGTLVILCLITGLFLYLNNDSFARGFVSGRANISFDVNGTYKSGFNSGYPIGSNVTMLSLIYYSRNCSVVNMNYSGHVFQFVDLSCVQAK